MNLSFRKNNIRSYFLEYILNYLNKNNKFLFLFNFYSKNISNEEYIIKVDFVSLLFKLTTPLDPMQTIFLEDSEAQRASWEPKVPTWKEFSGAVQFSGLNHYNLPKFIQSNPRGLPGSTEESSLEDSSSEAQRASKGTTWNSFRTNGVPARGFLEVQRASEDLPAKESSILADIDLSIDIFIHKKYKKVKIPRGLERILAYSSTDESSSEAQRASREPKVPTCKDNLKSMINYNHKDINKSSSSDTSSTEAQRASSEAQRASREPKVPTCKDNLKSMINYNHKDINKSSSSDTSSTEAQRASSEAQRASSEAQRASREPKVPTWLFLSSDRILLVLSNNNKLRYISPIYTSLIILDVYSNSIDSISQESLEASQTPQYGTKGSYLGLESHNLVKFNCLFNCNYFSKINFPTLNFKEQHNMQKNSASFEFSSESSRLEDSEAQRASSETITEIKKFGLIKEEIKISKSKYNKLSRNQRLYFDVSTYHNNRYYNIY